MAAYIFGVILQVLCCLLYTSSEKGIPYKNKDLIMNAFVHSSYVNEHKTFLDDNERLEFMGDAVLQVWTTTKLFLLEPPLHLSLIHI